MPQTATKHATEHAGSSRKFRKLSCLQLIDTGEMQRQEQAEVTIFKQANQRLVPHEFLKIFQGFFLLYRR